MNREKSVLNSFIKAFILLLCIPIIIINIVVNGIYRKVYLDRFQQQINKNMEYLGVGVENELRNRFLTATTITYDREIRDKIYDLINNSNQYMKRDIKMSIDQYILSRFDYMNTIHSVTFFMEDGQVYQYNKNVGEETLHNMKSDWYDKALNNENKLIMVSSNNDYITLAIGVDNTLINKRDHVLKVVYFSFYTDIFDSFYTKINQSNEGDLVIAESNGKVIAAQSDGFLEKNINKMDLLKDISIDRDNIEIQYISKYKKYISVYRTPKYNWIMMNIIDKNDLFREVNQVVMIANTIYLAMLLLFTVFCIYFFRKIIIPINQLIKVMKKTSSGTLPKVNIKGCGEIKLLEKQFYSMVYKIHKLMEERDIKEKERSKEEINALQAQINPHFIHNTLNSIRLMAMMSGRKNIKNMTEALMKLLSAMFRKIGNMVTVKEELGILDNYAYIMKVRFNDKFHLKFIIDEDILEFYIIKLIFQPIVENSITHALGESNNTLKIVIKGYKENNALIFKIVDNGCGISQERITEIMNSQVENKSGLSRIGLINIHKRIRLNYGYDYGISIQSKEGNYTSVKLKMPIIKEIDEYGDKIF